MGKSILSKEPSSLASTRQFFSAKEREALKKQFLKDVCQEK